MQDFANITLSPQVESTSPLKTNAILNDEEERETDDGFLDSFMDQEVAEVGLISGKNLLLIKKSLRMSKESTFMKKKLICWYKNWSNSCECQIDVLSQNKLINLFVIIGSESWLLFLLNLK